MGAHPPTGNPGSATDIYLLKNMLLVDSQQSSRVFKIHTYTLHNVMYLLAKLKPSEQKEHFSLKEQNGLGGI